MTVKKGLLVGVAVGGLLYVMWRRRKGNDAPPPEPAVAWEPFTEPVAQPEPVAEPEAVSEPAEAVAEAEPIAEVELEHAHTPEPQTAPVTEPVVADVRHEEPTLTHPGRQHPLTSTGFANRPRPATFSGVGRPQTARTRATWPGVAGAGQQRPKPFRLIPAPSRPASLRRSR